MGMPEEDERARPACKPEDPIWTILPSYYMYHSTFSGELDPPQYTEDPECASEATSRMVSSSLSSDVQTEPTSVSQHSGRDRLLQALGDGSFIVADESSNSWRETILDNYAHLRNLSSSHNAMAQALQLSVHFTKDVGERGVKPELIDPSLYEYKQGDYLNGFIYIRNEGTKPIPFDMFYVNFDGNFIVADMKNPKAKPVKIRRFLEMYDFAASWNPASVNRLLSEKETPFRFQHLVDPLDNSSLAIGPEKLLHPGILYKRFFTFKIPTRLLDSECNDHNLSGHTELPPTLGLCQAEKDKWNHPKQINDFSFIDTSISHNLCARFIGKASKYDAIQSDAKGCKLINEAGDEFVILKEANSFIRILQETNIPSDREKELNNEISRVMFNSFVDQLKERIAFGNELCKLIEKLDTNKDTIDISNVIFAEETVHNEIHNDVTKSRQLFHRANSARDVKVGPDVPKCFNVVVPYYKKVLFGRPKEQGTILLQTPKTDYLLSYISPERFRTRGPIDPSSWKVEIPIELTYTPSSLPEDANVKPPEILSIFGELIVFTLKSNNRPIPIELNHDFLFKNISKTANNNQSSDDFTHIVKRPMQQYAKEIYDLFKTLGTENFRVQKRMIDDLAALTKMDEKYNRLVLNDLKTVDETNKITSFKGIPWSKLEGNQLKKKFTLAVDVTKAQKMLVENAALSNNYKAYNEFTLVPSFQTCLMSRLYYFRFVIRLTGNQTMEFKLPVTIAKVAT